MSDDNRLMLLQEKLDNHIETYERHREEETARWDHLISCQEANTLSIQQLTDSTRDLVAVWQATDGTIKAMVALGKFTKWLSGFAVVGVVAKWFADHL